MDYHKLLNKQIQKLLTPECLKQEGVRNFINAVNESYLSFERDKELMNHAFSQSEEEYKELLHNLNQENKQKQKSISKLYASLRTLNENLETLQSEDLEELTEYFSIQIKKRKEVEDELNRQFEFQKILMKISSEYISKPFEEISSGIHESLKELAEYVNADRAYIFSYDFEANTCSNTFEYCTEGISPQIEELQNVPLEAMTEWVEANVAGKSISIPDVYALEESDIKAILEAQDIKSLLVIPMMHKDKCIGFVGFDSVKEHYIYTKTEEELLSLFASVVANAQERLSMESNMVRTVELLKTLLANLQYGILVEDENRRILFTNQLFCTMFQIPIPPDALEGVDCSNSAHQSKLHFVKEEEFPKRIIEILDKKEIVTHELLETKDGRFLERDYIPIFINNKYHGHLWKYNDITKRVLNQHLLELSEERNRLIMDSAINAIVTINCEGYITFWNKSAEKTFGWKKEDILNKKLSDTIIPEVYRERHKIGLEKYAKTGSTTILNKQMEMIAIHKKGEEFPIEISIIPIEQDGKVFFCSFIQDISTRKKAEQSLKVQEEKYRNIIANMNLGLIEVDNNETIKFANQSFCDVSGYNLEELIGRKPLEILLNSTKNNDILKHQIDLRKQGISSQYQLPVKNKRGELRWWVISGAPNYDDQGNLTGSIGIHLDITEQKKLEEEYKKEKEKALEASKAKEAFLANMSHEIRTPLNAIIGFLRELSKHELTTIQKQFVENSSNASQHLLSIINNVLDISKIEAGEMPLEYKDFSLCESVNNVINILKPKVEQKNIQLCSKFDEDLACVFKGDQMKIEQILFNLIGNSMKFTNQGKISVECKLVEDNPYYQKVKIIISDTGIGMSEEFINNIFKKFYQEDESIARRFGGTGLGMSITHELVKLMNGTISIQSKKNKGTETKIILLLNKSSKSALPQKKINAEELNFNGIKILLVEDNEMNRMVAQNSLLNFNCTISEAENGLIAIEMLKKQKFDLIFMDIQMPELDGIETTKILRNELHLDTPIVALTANAFKTEIEKCKAVGMDDYVTKPFTEENLLEVLQKFHHNKTKKSSYKSNFRSQPQSEELLYNLESLRKLSRGNEEFVKKMISIFITQTETTMPLVYSLFEKNEYLEISKNIHKIKPSIEGLGISSILNEVRLLETNAKDENPNHVELFILFTKIEKILQKVVAKLKENTL